MTDVTDLGEIRVVGQRRRNDGSFPSRGSGAGGGGNNDTGAPEQEEVDPGDFTPDDEQDLCSDPVRALEWNADAAAAEARRQFLQKAAELGDDRLHHREFGAQLYQRSNGSVYVGAVTWGPRLAGTVTLDESNPFGDTPIGEVHSHAGGNRVPSAADWERVDIFSAQTGQNYRSYIVARDIRDRTSDVAIRAYDTRSDRNVDIDGPEVNPDAQPCP